MAKASSQSQVDYSGLRRKATAALLLGLSAFVLVSMLTFSRSDIPANSFPANTQLVNWCGVAGAALAHHLSWWFGAASLLIIVLGGASGLLTLFTGRLQEPWMKLFGSIMLVASVCSAASMFSAVSGDVPPGNAIERLYRSILANGPSNGGAVGFYLTDWLKLYCGATGAWLIIGLAAFFGLLFLGVDRVIARKLKLARSLAVSPGAVAAPTRKSKPKSRKKREKKKRRKKRKSAQPDPDETETVATEEDEDKEAEQEDADASPEEPEETDVEDEPSAEELAEAKRRADVRRRLEKKVAKASQPDNKKKKLSKEAAGTAAVHEREDYDFPQLDLLEEPKPVDIPRREEDIRRNIEILEKTLADFKIEAEVVDIDRGPAVTRYELMLAPGIKVNRITGLSNDIAMAVKASVVRVVAPIPGKSTVGVEIPNSNKEFVRLRELLESENYTRKDWALPVFLGKDSSGTPIVSDLAVMPHLLIAGATGSGKSVCINSMITSFLMVHHPEDVRLILVDPKIVELQPFEGIPHLLTPVITDVKRSTWILDWAVKKMDERYDLLARAGVRHIRQYNDLGDEGLRERLGDDVDYDTIPAHLPYVVLIVDEMADLMMTSGKEVEQSITRLAQKSRAVGIHLILATQRPSVDVITGLIKANLPTRISFQVYARVDSRTILDRNGADELLGSGDCLFVPPQSSELIRLQGAFVSDRELRSVVKHVTKGRDVEYALDLNTWGVDTEDDPSERDALYDKAVRVILEKQRGSVSQLQRDLSIGYTRAARLVDMMAAQGIVGPYKGSQAREVMFTLEEWLEMQGVDTSSLRQDQEDEEPPLEAAVEADDDESDDEEDDQDAEYDDEEED